MGSRSGSAQTLKVDSVTFDSLDGLSNVDLTPTTDTYTIAGGGIVTTHNAGGVMYSGGFSVVETEDSNQVLLGQNGARKTIVWNDGVAERLNAECILTVERVFEDRGPRRYNVTFMVDGELTS